jgi:hypothetical protein
VFVSAGAKLNLPAPSGPVSPAEIVAQSLQFRSVAAGDGSVAVTPLLTSLILSDTKSSHVFLTD